MLDKTRTGKKEINTTETEKGVIPKTGKNTIMESTQEKELEKEKYKEKVKPKTKCKESQIREKREQVHRN